VTGAERVLYLPAGTAPGGPFVTELTPQKCGWAYSSLRVLELGPGGEATFRTGPDEMLVLPLSGGATVAVDGAEFTLAGRADVFSRVTDFAYLPIDAAVTVRSAAGGRFALPGARAGRRLPPRYGPAEQVPVEIRGSGQATRQVNNFCAPDAFETDRLTSVEVLTPGGNWSSYPPHKHDSQRPGESVLEEIYYFEVADGPAGTDTPGLAYQRVYGTPERPANVLAEVRGGDVVIVPHGWHGPSMAAPGYDLYYLNVMAGPGKREWLICDDPAHSWVREQWKDEQVEPRVAAWTAP
jgi:5-deoxy-glucuronate isomerase